MMIGEVRYQVFVSSTYDDLREERQQATQAILEMAHMPAGMELFPASDSSQWELIKKVIAESDYYIVIVGGRYGSVHPSTGTSFTEMEYDYALSIGVPVLGFVKKNVDKIPAGLVEKDPVGRERLQAFRSKVMSRICRLFDEPSELGLHVMKSLMSETRTNPRVGWVKADQARSRDDIEREQSLLDELARKDKQLKKLERVARDRLLPVEGIAPDQIAQGDDPCPISVTFTAADKQLVARTIEMTWDEVFGVIAPSMYGYILRRGNPEYRRSIGSYSFEGALIEYIRTKIVSEVGNRQINVLPHQIDTVLIQFKQLGLIEMNEKTRDEHGSDFRGYTLTAAGEQHLTRLKVRQRLSA